MPAFYSIVQYVPDPVIDERINVGVIVFGEGRVMSRFVDNWRRVRNFGSEGIAFLRKFADQAEQMSDRRERTKAGKANCNFLKDSPLMLEGLRYWSCLAVRTC